MAVSRVCAYAAVCVLAGAVLIGCPSDDDGGAPTPQAGTFAAGTGGMGAGGAGAGVSGGGAGGAPAEAGVPCDVARIVSANCTLCHTNPPKFGALMPLMTLADFQAPARSVPMRKVYEMISERINATDPRRRMPPTSSPALMPADLQTLTTWVTGGAQGVTTWACAIMAMP